MRTETVVLPAFLASALINGDTSGLEDEDMKWFLLACQYVAPGQVVDCSEESFFQWRNDLPSFNLGADCLEYTILYPDEVES